MSMKRKMARDDSNVISIGGCERKIDKTIDICTRSRETLEVRILPLTEKDLRVLFAVPPDVPIFDAGFAERVDW